MTTVADWRDLSARISLAGHRLIGWIFWDPVGIANYAALGVPDGTGYYIATRGAPLAPAGNEAVIAAFGSIHPVFVRFALDLCRTHTTFEDAMAARDAAVVSGLSEHVPDVVDGLAAFADELWAAADALSPAGRVLFAAHREVPRPEHGALSAWLALNCIREWRGDTHWAVQISEGLSMTAAGLLDGAWRRYADDWLPRSRGADDAAIGEAMAELAERGFVTEGRINLDGIAYRHDLEDRVDLLTAVPWQHLGEGRCRALLDAIEPAGARLMARVDATAGPNWMPAGRGRPTR